MLFVCGLKIKEINVYWLRRVLMQKTNLFLTEIKIIFPLSTRLQKKNFYKNEIILLLRSFKRGAAFCVISGFNSSDGNAASQTESTINKFL